MKVGERIKYYRLEKGWTQEELGKHLGVGKAAIQKYESGQVQNLKSSTIKYQNIVNKSSGFKIEFKISGHILNLENVLRCNDFLIKVQDVQDDFIYFI